MAKKVINAFNGGEVSPNTHARFDSTLYNKSCIKLENFIPMQAGGVERRPATKYLSTVSDNAKAVSYSFVFNNENAYTLIFTDKSLGIYSNETLKATITTSYLETELYDLKLTQSADIVFIAHPNHAVEKLSRVGDTNWTLNILTYKVPPLLDEDPDRTFSITGSTTKGSSISITANGNYFYSNHVGAKFLIKQPRDINNSISHDSNAGISTSATINQTITSSGTTATVAYDNHPFAVGSSFVVSGASYDGASYDGTFTVASVPDANSFTYTMPSDPSTDTVTANIQQQAISTASFLKSEPINMGGSNWSIETKGNWRGRVTVLRSLDGGDTYEEYVVIGDNGHMPIDSSMDDSGDISFQTLSKNYTFASTEPEPIGALLQVYYRVVTTYSTLNDYRQVSWELKAEDPYIYGLCLITAVGLGASTTSGVATATATLETPIAYTITDYGAIWAANTPFLKGKKLKFDGSLSATNPSSGGDDDKFVQLKDSSNSALTNVVGMAYGNAKLWVLTTQYALGADSGTQTIHKYTIANGGASGLAYNHDGNFNLSTTLVTRASDITYYNDKLYVIGGIGTFNQDYAYYANKIYFSDAGNSCAIYKYSLTGGYESTFYTFPETSGNYSAYSTHLFSYGLGNDGTHLYATTHKAISLGGSSSGKFQVKIQTSKIDSSGSLISTVLGKNATGGDNRAGNINQGTSGDFWHEEQVGTSTYGGQTADRRVFMDWTSIDGQLYALNDALDQWDVYDSNIASLSINLDIGNSGDVTLRGTGYDSANKLLYAIQDNGKIIEFSYQGGNRYYEAVTAHNSSSDDFSTWLSNGAWVQRFPEKLSLIEAAYSDHRGYPHSVAIYESRLCFGGTDSNPNTLWLSRSNDLDNFQTGVNATDSMRLTINSNTIDEIRWLCPSSSLVIGTSSNEWSLGSGSDQLAVTPTQFNIKRKSNYGSNKIQGTLVNASILFAMRQGTKLREWIDQNTKGVFLASDLTSIADHITEGGILQFAVQTQPETIIWAVRNDGTLLGLTYEKETETFGWHRHILGGRSGTATITVTDYANIAVGTTLALTKSDGTTVTFTSETVGASSPSTSLNWRPNTSNDVTADNIFTAINTHADFTVANPAANIVTITETTPATKGFLSIISSDNTRLAVTSETNTVCESVSVLPTATGEDCVYVIVKKENNERCYVKLDSRNWGTTYTTEYNGLDNYTTASKAVSSQSASFSANELDQFASDTVSVKVNGVLQTGTYTVGSNGSLTVASIKDASGANLANGTYTIVVGKPFTSTLAPLYIQSEATLGSKKPIQKATIRFKDTLSAKTGQTETNTDPVIFTSNSALNTEDAEVWLSNANEFLQTIYVVQDEPQPCTVLAMIANVEKI